MAPKSKASKSDDASAQGDGGGAPQGTAGGTPPPGTSPFTPAPGGPDGTTKSPFVMISKKEAREFNSVTTPFGRFFDMSTKEGSIQWYRMVKAADDHVKLDVTVEKSKPVLDLFIDLSTTFRWARYL